MPATMTPQERAREICRRDRAFRPLIKAVGAPPRRRSAPVDDRFGLLARSITHQLLATRAANTIHQRVIDVCGGTVSAKTITRCGHAKLRAVGLSNAKAAAMLDLAQRSIDGRIAFARHGRMTDEEVLSEVVEVRGVGPWTAQMYLLFVLGRPDVWPPGDLGVRNGWSMVHGLDEVISEADLRDEGDAFAGLRSDVAWYCWQAVHLARGQ